MKIGNVYKCKNENVCLVICEINLLVVKYIVADSDNKYCHMEESFIKELESELEDFVLVN